MNDHDRTVDAQPPIDGGPERAIRDDAIDQERLRLSRELHDGIGQRLMSLGYLLDELATADDGAGAAETIATAREQLAVIHDELRRTVHDLRDGDIHADDIGTALARFAHEVGRRHGLDVHVDTAAHDDSAGEDLPVQRSGRSARLPADAATELVRIGREAITNAAQHAGAHTLWLTVAIDPPTARVVVTDDGVGVPEHHRPDASGGHGMAIMAERAERIGGIVRIEDRPGGGTVVTVSTGEERNDDGVDLRTARRRP